VFERFTDRARRVVVLAQEEARLLDHNYIGTEHLLLGLVSEGEGVAARALTALDISLETVRSQVETVIGRGGTLPSGHIPFTPRAKKVLEFALREALQLGHNYIGTEHILLGLIREGEGVAAQVLVQLGADLDHVRRQVIQLLSGYAGGPQPVATALTPVGPTMAPPPSTRVCSFCGRDLWDVDRYVISAGAAICEPCVTAARVAIDAAIADAQVDRAVMLPPQVFGAQPFAPERLVAFQAAMVAGLEGDADAIEDGARLAPLVAHARAIHAGVHATHMIERVRLVDPDHAEFRYTIVVEPGGGRYQFDGRAVREDGRWKVARETLLAELRLGGVTPDEP
jgi:hypothetical protein